MLRRLIKVTKPLTLLIVLVLTACAERQVSVSGQTQSPAHVKGCSQNSRTSANGNVFEEFPQVKRLTSHSRSEPLFGTHGPNAVELWRA